jgi:hypothetical protein
MTMPPLPLPLVAAVGVNACRLAWHATQRAVRDESPLPAGPTTGRRTSAVRACGE